MAIQRRARGVRIPTPGGTVLGRLRGEGDAQPISVADLARQIQSTGVVGGGGSAPGSFTAGAGISITGSWPSLTFANTGVLSIAGTTNRLTASAATGAVTLDISTNYAGQATITTLGTITTGTWNGSDLTFPYLPQIAAGSYAANYTASTADMAAYDMSSTVGYGLKIQCGRATAAALAACTYSNGTNGVGATLTASGNGALSVDGAAVNVGDTLLIKDQATGLQNGIYTVTQTGSAGAPFILTRSTSYDTNITGFNSSYYGQKIKNGDIVVVSQGTTNSKTLWMLTNSGSGAGGLFVVGTDTLTFEKTGGVGSHSTGVSSVIAGTGVTVSAATGDVTISAPNAGAGNFLGRRVLSGSGTYTATSGTASIVIKMVGGGGAGGGVPATSSVQQAEGSGGGSGAVIETYLTSGFSPKSYGVGAAGAASSGANGGNGGDTTFDTRTAGGGTGGLVGVLTGNGVAGSAGGATAGTVAGDIQFAGKKGWYSSEALNGGATISGRGADAPLGYGFGGAEVAGSAAGTAATGYAAGGGGAINDASQSARSGGAGAVGIIVIDEYGPSAATSGVLSGLTTGKVPYATSASALGDSEIKDTGGTGGVEVGSPTGGQKGSGTLNAQGLYVNGVSVGRSLYSEVMSVLPTKSGTGLTTNLNFGGGGMTATDVATGICLDDPETAIVTNTLRGIYKTAPSTPYTITALILHEGSYANFVGTGIGWYDDVNAKAHVIALIKDAGGVEIAVEKWSSLSAITANDVITTAGGYASLHWLRIRNDGTTIFFDECLNGSQFRNRFSVALASSYLGSGNYKKILFWVNPNGAFVTSTLLSYAET